MFYIKLLLIYLFFSTILLSTDFNLSINPTKIELNLTHNSVTNIHLMNNGNKTVKLLPYFETPIEFQNNSLELMLECFPKFIMLKPQEEKIIKLVFKNKGNILKKNESYKSYIIFKELPNDSKSILNKDIIIFNEIGIGITGQN
ncbi:hypothetical protein NON08_09435 [Cetobacterium somerae]|uniref:hypothetical protein n=1 Tax=Cetobacterium sp. NK01 TaxID=2993530 RepID=UPI0021163C5E|nr:hypothetical protein [Cetobacterium sp. NK01]MCQ8212739.1 hypothetical protein [Cetobacterium sp. NK01]